MKDLEKQIEEAAETNANSLSKTIDLDELDFIIANNAFITGAKSPETKEYWQQGMYTEEEVKDLLDKHTDIVWVPEGYSKIFPEWFEQNKNK